VEVRTIIRIEIGMKTFQPSLISWSYLYLGIAALIQTNTNRSKVILIISHTAPGINERNAKGGSQPPKNKIDVIADIKIMFAYSPKKNAAKLIEEYSTLNPATSSDSASGKSNGCLFVSARVDIKKMINIGNNGIANHIFSCAITISVKFKEPVTKITQIKINPIETSYEII
jgi:hypothetical protein